MIEGPAQPDLRLLTRPDCGLCTELLDRLRPLLWPDATLQIEDVDTRADWRVRFGARIPVLIDADNQVVFEASEDPAILPQRLDVVAARRAQ